MPVGPPIGGSRGWRWRLLAPSDVYPLLSPDSSPCSGRKGCLVRSSLHFTVHGQKKRDLWVKGASVQTALVVISVLVAVSHVD